MGLQKHCQCDSALHNCFLLASKPGARSREPGAWSPANLTSIKLRAGNIKIGQCCYKMEIMKNIIFAGNISG